jgi:hypothetical protein
VNAIISGYATSSGRHRLRTRVHAKIDSSNVHPACSDGTAATMSTVR